MSEFIQIHLLTSFAPSNLNRDDLNRPKTAIVGGRQRLRVSSQSLKRAWRTSDLFSDALAGHVGVRTKAMGVRIFEALASGRTLAAVLEGKEGPVREPVDEGRAKKLAAIIAGQFGKLKGGDKKDESGLQELEIKQLAHFSPSEINAIDALLAQPGLDETTLDEAAPALRAEAHAADIALFGRMRADSPGFNVEAAAQVAHAITVHEVAVEDDYFTAVDDLNTKEDDAGAGHLGESEFGAGVFYSYICISKSMLLDNLAGDAALCTRTLRALLECAATVAPTGKQNSFASRAYASYIRAEKGPQQPRSLAVSFLAPVTGPDYMGEAIEAIRTVAEKMNKAYGACYEDCRVVDVAAGEGTMDELLSFVGA